MCHANKQNMHDKKISHIRIPKPNKHNKNMKRKLLTIAMLTTAMAMNAALKIDRIDPTDW